MKTNQNLRDKRIGVDRGVELLPEQPSPSPLYLKKLNFYCFFEGKEGIENGGYIHESQRFEEFKKEWGKFRIWAENFQKRAFISNFFQVFSNFFQEISNYFQKISNSAALFHLPFNIKHQISNTYYSKPAKINTFGFHPNLNMRKSILLSLVALVAGQITLFAATISQEAAQTIALNYFKVNNPNTRGTVSANLKYTQTESDGTIDFYVFDIEPAKSFVIVAADDNIIPILGHSEEGYFNPNFEGRPINHWIYKTSKNIYKAIQQHVLADTRIQGLWAAYNQGQKPASQKSTTVQALCTTTWDQENDFATPPPYLYNLYCPWNDTNSQRCLTGCVATAQAQVMKYWNYPATGTGSFSYADNSANGYSNNYGTQSSNFASHTYKWTIMPPVLTGLEPATQDTAVDVLMYDCAVSVGMDFGDDDEDGSGANALLAEELQYGDSNCSQHALVKYFSYNADSIKGVFESSYNAAAWTALIEHEMDMGRPVMYEGDDATQGGHCWVCDGYDADNNLHMNWGWSGFDNGYFAINNLTTSGNFNPILEDDALIGIIPKYPLAPITNFAASTTNTCNGIVKFMDFSQELPTSWLWNFGDGSTSTLQNPVHTYNASGTYTVTLTATNPAGSTPLTFTNYITVNLLQAPTVNNVSSSSPTSFSLSETTSDEVYWYDAEGNYLSNTNPYVTPVLDTTTTYYVENVVANLPDSAGPVNNQIGTGGYSTDPYALQFNAIKPCLIVSVYVYAKTAANRTIQVLDSTFNVIAQNTVYCPTGGSRAIVDLPVNAGGPYYMQVADTLGLYNNTSGGNYPYTDALGLVSITNNTTYDPTQYYYFYNWEVKEDNCTSARVPVTASITTGIIGIGGKIDFTLYPNPANNDVVLETNEAGNGTMLSVKNMLGQTLVNRSLDETQTHIDLSAFANGIYLVELTRGDKTGVQKLVVSK